VRTIWVLGDQLNRQLGPLRTATPGVDVVLMVESAAKLDSKRWHRQRAHLVVTAMRRFAEELRSEGFTVDYRHAASLRAGLAEHLAAYGSHEIVAMEPASWDGLQLLRRLGVVAERSDQFLCHFDEFAAWAGGRKQLKMEDFYRWQRRRLGYLIDGPEPCGGRWNFDAENREPLPKDGGRWPAPLTTPLDDLDRDVLAALPGTCWGAAPDGTWATTRAEALRRLDHVIENVLPIFGPHEDAMSANNWHLGHSLLSPYLNIGLLLPAEVCDATELAYRRGDVPLASAEGFIRQIIGWREYVWGVYWLWMPAYRDVDELRAHEPLPPVFFGGATQMRCLATTMRDIDEHGWTHHIQRLMILANLALRRWCGVGDAAQRARDGCPRRWRAHVDQAVRGRWCVHRPDEQLLQGLRLRSHEAGGRHRVPVHHALLVVPRSARRTVRSQSPCGATGSRRRSAERPAGGAGPSDRRSRSSAPRKPLNARCRRVAVAVRR
jgi:deoxyribodipyrimidine photolyase-related protein